jgi:hypothetical protein
VNKALFIAFLILAVGYGSEALSDTQEKQPPAPLPRDAEKTEVKKLREILASVDGLPPRNAKWVEICVGSEKKEKTPLGWVLPGVIRGWLLRESPADLQLLDEFGEKRTFDNRKRSAKTPAADFQWPEVRTLRHSDFVSACRDLLRDKVKRKDKDDPNEFGIERFQRDLREADAAVLSAARFACWADFIGCNELAPNLLKKAAEKLRDRNATFVGMPAGDDLSRFLADNTCPQSSEALDWDLERREPSVRRRHLLAFDKALATIPYRMDHDEILRKIARLERLVAEDKGWTEPSKAAIAKMDVRQKTAYWLYRLRDLKVIQSESPGTCTVVTSLPENMYVLRQHSDSETNAADELRNLGYEALPQIIDHMDDDRPTECVGFWRDFAPESYFTLAYGDCCQQIFEAITLHTIYEYGRYPIRDGKGKLCKQRAQDWWKEFQNKGEKQMLIEATGRGDRDSKANGERLNARYPGTTSKAVRGSITPDMGRQ